MPKFILDLLAFPFRYLYVTALEWLWRWRCERAYNAILPAVLAHNETRRGIEKVIRELEEG